MPSCTCGGAEFVASHAVTHSRGCPQRQVIDQLGTTGTYVTRDGDGMLRHWNGITDEYVSSEPDST